MPKSKPTTALLCGMTVLILGSALPEAQTRRPAPSQPSQAGRQAVPRTTSGQAVGPRARTVYGRGYGYRPYYHGFYDPYFFGQYGYPYGPYPYPYYGAIYDRGSLRLQVKPEETEVYVDGSFAEIVDSYDGVFQRLRLPPGEHELELYLDGYESRRESLYLVSGQTYKILHEMEPLAEGVPQPPRPQPLYPPQPPARPPGSVYGPDPAPGVSERFGSMTIRVQPTDAEIWIDGERWLGFEGLDRLVVELGEGRYVVEIRREGYRTYRTEVEVREGDTTFLNVSLPPTEGEVR